MLRRLSQVLAALGATAAIGAISTAAPSAAAQPVTFSGQCQVSGAVTFSPAMTNTPRRIINRASATGTCSGTLTAANGQSSQLSDAPVQYIAKEVGPQDSCASNLNAPGTGELIFQQGTVSFQIVENRVAGTADLSFTGDAGGSASAVANVNSPDPQSILEQCAAGGVTSVPVDITIQTTPSISG